MSAVVPPVTPVAFDGDTDTDTEEAVALPQAPMVTRFKLPEEAAALLPAPFAAAIVDAADWGSGDVAAGLCVRWAMTTPQGVVHPLNTLAMDWWRGLTQEMRDFVEGVAHAGAVIFAEGLDALGLEPWPRSALQALAQDRDRVASSSELLLAVGRGKGVRAAEAHANERLRAMWEAQTETEAFDDPLLDLIARRGAGWWTVAPGAAAPTLDDDAFRVDDQAERDLLEDLDAFEDEE